MKTATLATALTRRVGDTAADYAAHPKRTVAAEGGGAAAAPQTIAVPGGEAFPAFTLKIHRDLERLLPLWQGFEQEAHATLFQNSLWCRAWLETAGARLGARPVIVAGRAAGRLCFLLPLQTRPRQGLRVLEWLGSPNHNYGYPLLAHGFAAQAGEWFAAHWHLLLDAAGGFDAVALTANPAEMFGRPHPLAGWRTLSGADPSFALALEPEFETLLHRKFGNSLSRQRRRKEARLAQLVDTSFGLPANREEAHTLLDTLFAQHAQRLSERGVPPAFGPDEKRFFHRILDLQDEAAPLLHLYRLTLDGAVVAMLAGGVQAGTFWALMTSLAPGHMRRFSPGDMVLRRTIEACCERGIARYDFSPGDFSYKRRWADEATESFAILAAANLRGLLWASAMLLALAAKRRIKRTPVLYRAAQRLRLWLFRRP